MESEDNQIVWTPTVSLILQANITRFAEFYRSQYQSDLGTSYEDLHTASIRQPGLFWQAVWRFCQVVGNMGGTAFVPGKTMMDGRWFPDARINFAETVLKPDQLSEFGFAQSTAIFATNERGERTVLTRRELDEQVRRIACFLKKRGIGPGDRVVAIIPNIVEAVVGMLATAAVGAVWSSCSPEFGDDAICDRFGQVEPKVLLATSECQYGGKPISLVSKLDRILARLPTIRTLLFVGQSDLAETSLFTSSTKPFWWNEVVNETPDAFTFERFPFDHPLCIVYSSGTTGAPKCIVHSAGGTALQHAKEHSLHCDLKPGDTLFYYTTTGWMMWNWLLSGIASGAAVLLYDGSPFANGSNTLWSIAENEGVTHFGASPRYYMTLQKDGYEPSRHFKLGRIRSVMSTGSPLLPETFDWMYRAVGPDICLASISGGTDILSCFVLGNPTLPVVRGQIQCKGLGMDVQVFDSQGKEVVGVPGELVCVSPFPSMPIRFWNDPDGKKYRASYFEHFEDVWCHGDWAQAYSNGGFVIFGRSDTTLNPSGVRIGTAEIYQQVEAFSEIAECLATVLRSDGDEQIVLFVKMKVGQKLHGDLATAVRKRLKERCSPRHVPAYLVEAPDLPRTNSGKLSEIAVRQAIGGRNLDNAGALANPECLDFFVRWKPNNGQDLAPKLRRHFLLFYDVVDDYVARRLPYRPQHLLLAQQAADRGELVLGGALVDPVDKAVLLFCGENCEVAERFALNDPYVQNGLVLKWTVREWTTLAGYGMSQK